MDDDVEELRSVSIWFPNGDAVWGEFWLSSNSQDDTVTLTIKSPGFEITKTDSDYFGAMVKVRTELELNGLLINCYGSSLNVYPSPMMRSMGDGSKAYKLTMGQPAKSKDIVSIFD